MMDEKQIESLKRRYGSRIADAPKRRRGPERMAVMKGGKPKAGGQTMLRLLSYLKRDRMAMTVAFFCVILGTVTNLAGAYMLRPIINRYIVPLDGSRGDVAGLFRSLCVMGAVYLVSVAAAYMQSRIMLQVAQNALQREQEIKTMYALSRRLNEEIDIRQIARLAAEVLAGVLQAEVRCLCLDENEQPAALYGARPGQSAVPLSGDETAVNDKTGLPPSGDTVELPLQNNGIRLAVLQIPLETMNTISEADKQLVQSLSETITLAMDRFRTAKQKIRSEEEAAQERYRSNLLRAISHDLRTPLSAIMGSAEMIRGMSQENDPRYDLAQGIYQDADWLHSLVENILSLTRIQDGHLNLHLEKEAAEEIIASALDHIAKRAPQRTIQVSIPDEVLMIPMDGKLIQQVLINLLDNALKHTRPQEEITLTLRREQNEAVFTVQDEGEGIAEKDLEHIFQTFYTTRTRRADAQHGIGLGLPICESIVQAHHGTISARNRTDGHGAEFTFRLPLEETR